MKSFLKNHRYTIILVLIFALLALLGFKVKDILIPDEGKATYGERLKNIDKHPLTDEIYQKVDDVFKDNKNVLKIEHRQQGRILNYYVTLDDKVSIKDAKAIGDKLVGALDEDTLGYYSIQIYMQKNDAALNNFPIIGLKDPLSDKISWTKDREITVSDQNEE